MTDRSRTPADQRLRLDGQVALVTGGARGIGRGVAATLASAGAEVWVADLDEAAAVRAAAELATDGAVVHAGAVDVRDEESIRRLVARVVARGSLDIVVANAGRMFTGDLGSTTAALWEDGVATNLTGAFLTARATAAALRRSGRGRLVFMSSGAAFDPRTVTGLPYAVAKAGVNHLTAMLALEFAGTGATVNAVAPGPVDTDMSAVFDRAALQRYVDASPLGRMAEVDDVAAVVHFLVSELGAFVNGQVIRVAGGP